MAGIFGRKFSPYDFFQTQGQAPVMSDPNGLANAPDSMEMNPGTPPANPSGNMGIDTSLPPDPYAGQRIQPPAQSPGFFGKLGVHNIGDALGFLGDLATFGPAAGAVRHNRALRDQTIQTNHAYKMAEIKKAMDPTDETPAMKNAKAIGLTPGTPGYQQFLIDAQMKPDLSVPGAGTYSRSSLPGGDYGLGWAPPDDSALPLVTDQTSYNALPRGATYRDPQGTHRIKQ